MADKQEQEITAEITAEQLGYFAHMRDSEGETGVATIYRRAARTIGRLKGQLEHYTRLVPTRQNLRPNAAEWTPAESSIDIARRVVEAAGCSPALTDAATLLGYARNKVAEHVIAEREARQPEPVPAPSGAVYEVRDGELFVYVEAVPASFWTQSHAIYTEDLDHVHALMHGRAQ